VALTGGIACYKAATVVSRLAQAGAQVQVLMTESATRFIAPLTLQSLSNRPVVLSLWQSQEHYDAQHIALARWAELMLIAPCTANTIAKLAAGICDEPVSLTAYSLPSDTPTLIAPAMNADMWANPITDRNLATLTQLRRVSLIGPEMGWQACRTSGAGRMSEPEAVVQAVQSVFQPAAMPPEQIGGGHGANR
jgi:phosphopantothenoylcysteine decarboxylase/phosphopantothenate--cysteine ligase